MSQVKRRANPANKKTEIGSIVRATMNFTGVLTPPPPVWMINQTYPIIRRGTEGIFQGLAMGALDLYDVAFESDDNETVRVEVRPDQIEFL